MGTIELARALGVSKALISKLALRGMPLTSAQAAQAWRETNAKPRRWKAKELKMAVQNSTAPTDRKSEPPERKSYDSGNTAETSTDDPAESLSRARDAERSAYLALQDAQRNGGSPEDLRKSSTTYFASRNNRQRAEDFFDDWQRRQNMTLLFEEARELAGKPHEAVKQMLAAGAKSLAPRLVGMSQRSIEASIGDWIDNLTDKLRASL
jgi:hypothetical protein